MDGIPHMATSEYTPTPNTKCTNSSYHQRKILIWAGNDQPDMGCTGQSASPTSQKAYGGGKTLSICYYPNMLTKAMTSHRATHSLSRPPCLG
ncbi:T. brucei spp.-specific protein [Trypanosoma brucei gambiense DAL972]|uniref:T. brucei spp.-specific protein n=1 Tax=Trypanosoma brucei gambiense (strain MHOM/CI/86/DAL972) TaxID=679716 RepID=C9ZXE0_TRYB9|nr:T. brucei spp.-specific protein [Trypanosoma brucei gambiense DAL972]CBH14084.1 T. brucei spp.-specific protein [Trypanosoma brucei gambiense DAL972]|eukprot:XP_011776355.1 T. brucei spp.-specific protein [Trypanosoma brucei gambiense DAL972]